MTCSVAALIATYRRPAELRRLLHSLAPSGSALAAVIVVDNEGSDEVRDLVQNACAGAHYINPGANLGCGGGLHLAEERALQLTAENFTHLLILDDDAVLSPDTLSRLLAAMEQEGADLACPLVIDERGRVGWLPGLPRHMQHANGTAPEEFREKFGTQPHPFIWSQGICLLVSRRAIEQCGFHRDDFWVRGEDLEFSLRVTAQFRAVMVPEAVVQHLPPPATPQSSTAEYLKHCAMVQNIAYVSLRLPHGRRVAWTNFGALRDFLRIWSWRGLVDLFRAWWRAIVLGEAAGRGAGRTFFKRLPAA